MAHYPYRGVLRLQSPSVMEERTGHHPTSTRATDRDFDERRASSRDGRFRPLASLTVGTDLRPSGPGGLATSRPTSPSPTLRVAGVSLRSIPYASGLAMAAMSDSCRVRQAERGHTGSARHHDRPRLRSRARPESSSSRLAPHDAAVRCVRAALDAPYDCMLLTTGLRTLT